MESVLGGIHTGLQLQDAISDNDMEELVCKATANLGYEGVDKPKLVQGTQVMHLRFISILVPINSYLRSLRGDARDLPYLGQLTLLHLGPEEELLSGKIPRFVFALFIPT